ncbi:hypothetical protein [Flammeovirga agarivorans]|uniref:Uncharacterized protein n=1 Tax=Flammeovirga agarivorans TaxID=2726742 RepID=A0A7X8SPK6_9BACT|nr:hypothetical protein [Flammeovirga agarivorans]NLR94050.1 hypothetical protein [Flammeovirga agarivorans]
MKRVLSIFALLITLVSCSEKKEVFPGAPQTGIFKNGVYFSSKTKYRGIQEYTYYINGGEVRRYYTSSTTTNPFFNVQVGRIENDSMVVWQQGYQMTNHENKFLIQSGDNEMYEVNNLKTELEKKDLTYSPNFEDQLVWLSHIEQIFDYNVQQKETNGVYVNTAGNLTIKINNGVFTAPEGWTPYREHQFEDFHNHFLRYRNVSDQIVLVDFRPLEKTDYIIWNGSIFKKQ